MFQASPDKYESIFRQLFDKYKKPLHDYLYAITASQETAQDIVQEIFLRLWKKRGELDKIKEMDHFIFRMARNEAMDYFHRLALDAKLTTELLQRLNLHADAGPALQLEARDAGKLLEKAIAELSPQRQKVYRLSRHEGLSIEEIAERLDLSHNTVKNHLVEALRQLREFMARNLHWLLIIILLKKN